MTTFLILKKIFLKIKNLMCVLKTHVNRIYTKSCCLDFRVDLVWTGDVRRGLIRWLSWPCFRDIRTWAHNFIIACALWAFTICYLVSPYFISPSSHLLFHSKFPFPKYGCCSIFCCRGAAWFIHFFTVHVDCNC